jgi:lysyl-tRNA synthetase class II
VTAYIEPRMIEPTILYDYPLELSPFARQTDDDPQVVERSSTTSAAWSSETRSPS